LFKAVGSWSAIEGLFGEAMLQEEKQGLPPQEKLNIKAVTIPTGRVSNEGVVFYVVNVKGSFNSWSVEKRYSQFEELQLGLVDAKGQHSLHGLPTNLDLPPKKYKLFTSHISPQFIEERRCLLENYLRKLLTSPDLAKNEMLLKFLTTDKCSDITQTSEIKSSEEMPDDVEITGVTIPATRSMSDHILYQIDVVNSRKRKSFSKWTVLKRFGQFYEMDCAVRASFVDRSEISNAMPAPPQRRAKLFNDHMDTSFVDQRRVLLENYLQKMLSIVDVVRNKDFLTFLGVNV